MDISVEYLMMCKGAEEIQKMASSRKMTNKDFLAKKDDELIWLPRMDQLVAMIYFSMVDTEVTDYDDVVMNHNDIKEILKIVFEFMEKGGGSFCTSLEQALLLYYMKNTFNKFYNVITKSWETV